MWGVLDLGRIAGGMGLAAVACGCGAASPPASAVVSATSPAASAIASDAAPVTAQVASDGATLRVFARGRVSAPALVAVNGGPGWSHDYMAATWDLAARGARVVLYDQRGTGDSSRPAAGDYGLPAYVADLDAVRAWTGQPRVVVLGHSFGAMLALAYAGAHPDRVRALVVVDAMPLRAADLPAAGAIAERQLQARASAHPASKVPRVGDDCWPEEHADAITAFTRDESPFEPAFSGQRCSVATALGTMRALGDYDVTPALSAVHAPVLYVRGEADEPQMVSEGEVLRALPHARRVVLPGCGHYVMIECRAAFDEAVGAFLEELAPTSAG